MSPTATIDLAAAGHDGCVLGAWGRGVPGVGYGWGWAGRAIPCTNPRPVPGPIFNISKASPTYGQMKAILGFS